MWGFGGDMGIGTVKEAVGEIDNIRARLTAEGA
jgi:hypothetical protein